MMTSPSSAASGMSKREFFAARAITGLATESAGGASINDYYDRLERKTKLAVEIADALIEALNAADTKDQ